MKKREKDRRNFAAVLALGLLVCFIISIVIGNTPANEEEVVVEEEKVDLENESLDLQYDDVTGTVIINGEGDLSADDISVLLTQNDVIIPNIENIIIGDGITEIGYNAFNGYEYLYSIKFGRTVEKIRNGAVKKCPNLKYVYVPTSVKKIARDFLYGTSRCYVISDGQILDMIAESNAENTSVVENIVSYEDLISAIKENRVIYKSFPADKLSTTDPEGGKSPIILHSNYIQYGPYATLEKGDYTVHLLGKGFSILSSAAPYVNIGGYTGEYSVSAVSITDDLISYNLTLSEGANNVEMALNNNSVGEVEIYELQIFEKVEIPDAVKAWW